MFRLVTSRKAFTRCFSSIPFDTKPFPFRRFEPCCPDAASAAENGFLPCKEHPFPNVIGKKIDFETDMVRLPTTNRHMVVCVGEDGPEWHKAKVEKVKLGMVQAVDNIKHQETRAHQHHDRTQLPPGSNTLLTICDRERIKDSKLNQPWPVSDVLLFPAFHVAKAVDPFKPEFSKILDAIWTTENEDIDKIKEYVQVENLANSTQAVVLICTHRMPYARCGVLGPILVEEFKRCLKKKSLYGEEAKKLGKHVDVYGTSHFGGHKFAGNLIIHSPALGGHMYGNVRACHVDTIIDRHIIDEKVIREIWRGSV
ncbi:Sucrase/ferredoxin-like-domain-containing protein [Umbelopsis sp. PMI_123]|nr:Sucrase/ferredoxin-like-domain-containing protein [Umbelopsis sp. PMI_123]